MLTSISTSPPRLDSTVQTSPRPNTDNTGSTVHGGQGSGKTTFATGLHAREKRNAAPPGFFRNAAPPGSPRKPAETRKTKEINRKSKKNKANTYKNKEREGGSPTLPLCTPPPPGPPLSLFLYVFPLFFFDFLLISFDFLLIWKNNKSRKINGKSMKPIDAAI